MKKFFTLSLILSGALVFAACTHNAATDTAPVDDAAESDTMMQDVETLEDSMEAEGDAMMETDSMMEKSMLVDMFMYGYSEEVIEVKPGQTVTINLTNSDGFHDFVIDELDVQSEQIPAGETTSVTFTVPEDAAGQEYEYYCSVGDHRAKGMVGTLRVTE